MRVSPVYEFTARTAMLVGEAGVGRLAQSHVAVFGVGGVGGAACEALARAGVGALTLFDDDIVAPSNLNRQVVALHSTLGRPKAEVMAARITDINPACQVTVHRVFYLPENAAGYPFDGYDYIVDAIDTVSAKLELIGRARAAGVTVISAMGAGNKLHPELFRVAPIEKTSVCPLARVMRKELKKRGITGVKAVFSLEEPLKTKRQPPQPGCEPDETAVLDTAEYGTPPRPGTPKKNPPGSISFVPAAAGLVLAGEVVRDLLSRDTTM